MTLKRSVRTRLAFALLALAAAALFVRLGMWQWQRGRDSDLQRQRFEHGTEQLVPLGDGQLAAVPLYQRVAVSGSLDGAHQFLLDNRSYQGRPGYEVLTPLRRPGAPTFLVDRGWVPFTGSRTRLPDVALATTGPGALVGRAAPLPSAGMAFGHAAPGGPWPRVTAFPTMAELAAAYGAPLEARILLLDPGSPGGYVRDWHPPGIAPLRHYSYAIQWWSFAALALLVWAITAFRRRAGRVR